jgi:CheY-like chemotaxis protein
VPFVEPCAFIRCKFESRLRAAFLLNCIFDVSSGARNAGNSVPVVYMTGNDSPAVREAAHQSGCVAYLTKPFSAKSLIEPLKKASAGRS